MAARHFFWDVGAFGGVDGAADADLAERHGDQWAERGDAAGGDANAVFDGGPDGDSDGCVWSLVLVRCHADLSTLLELTQEITIPALGTVLKCENIWQSHNSCGRSDGGESQQANYQALLAHRNLQVLDDPEREQAECPVCDDIETRNGEDQADKNGGVQASSIMGVKSPECFDRLALEQEDEEQDRSKEYCQSHNHSDDPDV